MKLQTVIEVGDGKSSFGWKRGKNTFSIYNEKGYIEPGTPISKRSASQIPIIQLRFTNRKSVLAAMRVLETLYNRWEEKT